MSAFRNLPVDKPEQLKDLVDVVENQVVSMALSKSDAIDMIILSFPKGESISEETYFYDTLYYIIEGDLRYTDKDKEYDLVKGDVFLVKGGVDHALECIEDLKLLQITINE